MQSLYTKFYGNKSISKQHNEEISMVSNSDSAYAPIQTNASTSTSGKFKEKRRNNEKRKEKSREAARNRRSRESKIFSELAQVLPLKIDDINHLDKASVMRIAIAYFKVRKMLRLFPKMQEKSEDNSTLENETFNLFCMADATEMLAQTLDGFFIILSNDGDINYASESFTDYLGITKTDVLGQQIWEYSHQCDHLELRQALSMKHYDIPNLLKCDEIRKYKEQLITDRRSLFIRFKCALTGRDRNVNVRSTSYKVIHLTGHLIQNVKGDLVFMAIGRAIPHPSYIEIPLGTATFLTKHRTDMKFTYIDDRMFPLLGYKSEDLLEKSFFDCHHGEDSDSLMITFKSVFSKGQGETPLYRFLGKLGGYCWIVTQATVLYDKLKPQSVVCVNYIISNLEKNNEICSLAQYQSRQKKLKEGKNDYGIKRSEGETVDCTKKLPPKEELNEISKPGPKLKDTIEEHSVVVVVQSNLQLSQQKQQSRVSRKTEAILEGKISVDSATIERDVQPASLIATNNNPPLSSSVRTDTALQRFFDISGNSISATDVLTQQSFNRNPQIINTTETTADPPADKHDKLPKSVTSSVFRATQHNVTNNNTRKKLNKSAKAAPQPSTSELLQPLPNAKIGHTTLLSNSQLSPLSASSRVQSVTASVFTPISTLLNKQQQKVAKVCTATAAIFNAQLQSPPFPRTEDMNKDFLSFEEDATELTMLKEETEGLANLTPTTVDAGVPLGESTPLFSEMLEGLMPYGLLPDDINTLDSTTLVRNLPITSSSNENDRSKNNSVDATSPSFTLSSDCRSPASKEEPLDPFISYREESNDTVCSQHILSSSIASKSPEASSLPSLCSPNSLSQEDEFAFMTMNVDDDIDLTMRAPYIPMNEQDDLPLLTADDLMWCGGTTFHSEDMNIHKDDVMQFDILKQQKQEILQEFCSNRNLRNYLHQEQHYQNLHQQQFHDSLRSSPMSMNSSISPLPMDQQDNQQDRLQQNSANTVFSTDSTELTALLCGSGNGSLTLSTNSVVGSIDSDSGGATISSSQDIRNCIIGVKSATSSAQEQNAAINTADFRLHNLCQRLENQQQQLFSIGIGLKKETFEKPPVISESIDNALQNICNDKHTTNIDCWNEMLKISVNEVSAATSVVTTTSQTQELLLASQHEQHKEQQPTDIRHESCRQNIDLQIQLEHQQQNIVLDTTTSTTLHEPSISIHDKNITTSSGDHGSKFTISIVPSSATTTPSVSVNSKIDKVANIAAAVGAVTAQQQQYGNKRHLSVSSKAAQQMDAKRSKNNISNAKTALQTSTYLLEHLMAPSQQQMESKIAAVKLQQRRNTGMPVCSPIKALNNPKTPMVATEMSRESPIPKQQQKQSNSVLKNLLISGCDVRAGYCLEPMVRKNLAKT